MNSSIALVLLEIFGLPELIPLSKALQTCSNIAFACSSLASLGGASF